MSPGELVPLWWEDGDHAALVAACDPGAVWDLSRFDGWEGDPVQRGPGGVRDPLGEELDHVLLCVRHAGDRDGRHVEEVGGLVYAVRPDGKIDRWTVFRTPELARAWIALRQAPTEAQ